MMGIVHRQEIIERQILAMGVAHFDIASRKQGGSTIEHSGLYLTQLWGLIDVLRERNEKLGETILLRPHGEHGMSLIEGLSYQRVQQLKVEGFEPAIVVQYGPDLHQAWLKHDRKLDKATNERVTRQLAEHAQVNTDIHWDSYGYMANFRAPAWVDEHRAEVKLVEDSGKVYSRASQFLSQFS